MHGIRIGVSTLMAFLSVTGSGLSLMGTCQAADLIEIRGALKVEGDQPKVLSLEARPKEGQRESLEARPGETFTVEVKGDVPIAILPRNEAVLATTSKHFYRGYGIARGKEAVQVVIKALPVREVHVVVTDQEEVPVKGFRVSCLALVPMGDEPDAPTWENSWGDTTGVAGNLVARFVEGVGRYRFEIRGVSPVGELYSGQLLLTAAEMAGKDSIPWKITRKVPSAEIKVKWDTQAGLGEFVPDIAGNMFGHTLQIDGMDKSETLLTADGRAFFYDLRQGSYQLKLSNSGSNLYRISGGSETLVIPQGFKAPVAHVLTIVPVKAKEIAGLILDAKTGTAIESALIMCGGAKTKSGVDGTFTLKVIEGANRSLELAHLRYYPTNIPLPKDAGAIRGRMEPLPLFTGEITFGGKPGTHARLNLWSLDHHNRIVVPSDGQGKWSQAVLPGKYRLEIKMHYLVDPNKPVRQELPKALLFEGEVEIPKEGRDMKVTVGAVSGVDVKVELSEASKNRRPLLIALLRESDLKMVCETPVLPDNSAQLVSTAGSYLVLVAADKETGSLAAKVIVREGERASVTAQVAQWQKMSLTKDGKVEMAR